MSDTGEFSETEQQQADRCSDNLPPPISLSSMATIDSASSWHGSDGSCRNQCATRMADLARHQPLEMEGTLAHSMIPTMDSATTDVDRKCGSLDVDLDRKFLNNNNTTSMKCLQFTRPPDPSPAPALLFDYVVEKSIQSPR